ncbi:MAG: hypothetical protein ACTSU5_02540 [Promethearchaeota archaeon]
MKTVSIRLEEGQDREVELYARKHKIDKSTAARKILDEGLKLIKTQEALENVRLKRWTVWKAAAHCGKSFRSFLELLRGENIPFPMSASELERELLEDGSE